MHLTSRRVRAALVASLAFSLAAVADAQQSARANRSPKPIRPHLKVALAQPTDFTGAEQFITFNGFTPGQQLPGVQAGQYVAFTLTAGNAATVWSDTKPRPSMPSGADDLALRARQPLSNIWTDDAQISPPNVPNGLPLEPALRFDFSEPVSRIGFDIRSATANLTFLATLYVEGRPVGMQPAGVTTDYRFFAVESSIPFEAIRLDLINPDAGQFSIDNLRFELETADDDGDGVPNFADVCPTLFNPAQVDDDGDGIGNACDPWPLDPDNDADGDGIAGYEDVCPNTYDPQQLDSDGDGIGDLCDPMPFLVDTDGDGIDDSVDNCVLVYNPLQEDCDNDGIGDTCDTTLFNPYDINVSLQRGETYQLAPQLCLPRVPPLVDILIAFDVTGSMGAEINNLKVSLVEIVQRVADASLPDVRFGLVTHRDYPGTYASCNYTAQYAGSGQLPYQVNLPFGYEIPAVQAAVNALSANGGADLPESYARVLYEIAQPDSGIDFRPGAKRVVLLVHDDIPHDCDPQEGLPAGCNLSLASSGADPGRDGIVGTADDIDFHDALNALVAQGTMVISLFSNPTEGLCAWTHWTRQTLGDTIRLDPDGTIPDGTNIVQEMLDLVGRNQIELLQFKRDPASQLIVQMSPNFLGPLPIGLGPVVINQFITVPAGLDPGITSLDSWVEVIADGARIATQNIHVDVLP